MTQRKRQPLVKIGQIKKQIVPILKKNAVVKAGIFGSFARGEAKKIVMLISLFSLRGKKVSLILSGYKLSLSRSLKEKWTFLPMTPYIHC